MRLCYGVLERWVLCCASHAVGNRTDTSFSAATESKRVGIAKFQLAAISEDITTRVPYTSRRWRRRVCQHPASTEMLSCISTTLCKRPSAFIQVLPSQLVMAREFLLCIYKDRETRFYICITKTYPCLPEVSHHYMLVRDRREVNSRIEIDLFIFAAVVLVVLIIALFHATNLRNLKQLIKRFENEITYRFSARECNSTQSAFLSTLALGKGP